MIPASIRNNNPGAMYPGPAARKFGSSSYETLTSKDGVHKIATFPTPIHGAAAQFDLLWSKYCNQSVEAAITKWCGAHYVSTYLKVLNDNAGIQGSDPLTKALVEDPAKGIPLAKAMAKQEAGRDFPLSDEEWRHAHDYFMQVDSPQPAFAPDNDVPSPRPETRQAAALNVVTKGAAVGTAAAGVASPVLVGGDQPVPTVPTANPIPPSTLAPDPAALPDLGQVSAWSSFVRELEGMATWAWGHKPIMAAAVGTFILLSYGLPWLKAKMS